MKLALLCCAIAVLAAACGSSGGPLSRTAFIQQANETCRELSTQEQQLSAKEHTNTAINASTAFDLNLGYLDDAVTKFDKIDPPQLDRAKFNDLRTQFHSMVSFLHKNRGFFIVLTLHLQEDPQDTKAVAQFEKFIKPFDDHAAAAAGDAHTLVLNACEAGLKPAGG